jgi:hypothetical protein
MDTEWFGVDKDGHVARFISQESGAVPKAVRHDEDPSELLHRLSKAAQKTQGLYEWTGRVRMGSRDLDHHRGAPYTMDPGLVVMFLWNLEPVKRDLKEGRAHEVPAVSGYAVVFKKLTKSRAEKLHKTNACRGCFWPYDHGEETPSQVDAAGLGLFTYKHTEPDTIAGPYGRTQRPVRPLLIGEIPEDLRKLILPVRFDSICFAHAPQIQPLSHLPCQAWEPSWLDLDGVTQRCVPGKEKEYREYYQEMDGIKNLHLEPPP